MATSSTPSSSLTSSSFILADGPRHFDYKPMRTEDMTGVWESAAANMRTYLMLKERAAAFARIPRSKAAMAASGWGELAEPTLAANRDLSGPSRRGRC